jgi:hypothetical protein
MYERAMRVLTERSTHRSPSQRQKPVPPAKARARQAEMPAWSSRGFVLACLKVAAVVAVQREVRPVERRLGRI